MMRSLLFIRLLSRFAWLFGLALAPFLPSLRAATGEEIYQNLCVKCHGGKGEGVADKYDEPLTGDKSIEALARIITKSMPDKEPEKCVGEDAQKVAAYIFDAFYSPAARVRNQPPRFRLARLTNRQYENAVADLAATFIGAQEETFIPGGLAAEYFNGRRFRNDEKAIERTDPQIDFSFGEDSPDPEKIPGKEFSIRWKGSLAVSETGDYEFSVTSENGVRLWVNDPRDPLIDEWVSSGREPREHRETIRLLGGRVYPIRLEFFRFSEKTASIKLQWHPPRQVWQIIPERNLSARNARETFVVMTPFPPDDSSVGYARGVSVSKAWEQATTQAAIEMTDYVMDHLESFSGVRKNDSDRAEKLQQFCRKFAERAFRRPLDEATADLYVVRQFSDAPDLESGVKCSLLLILKSPRFLYPELPRGTPDHFDIASRLSFALWDSLPDDRLLAAAASGKLTDPAEIGQQAERMLRDPRARAKLNGFFDHWLKIEEGMDMSKDKQAFPDFDDGLLSDLRTSLNLFVNQIVWSDESDYRQLLLADYLLLNNRLSKFYDLGSVEKDRFVRVKVDAKQRAGVITHPYLLATFAYHKSSSPIHRGVFLARNIVGRTLRPPPMAIQFMDGRFDPSLTMREKVTELTSPNNCQACHSIINPLGFSLESFDGVGRFRTTDNDKPVDTVSDYLAVTGQTVHLSGARDVAEYAANSPEAQRAFIQQVFHHLIKQPAEAYGTNTVERLHEAFVKSKFNVQKLLIEAVKVATLPAPSDQTAPAQKLAQNQK